MLGTNFFFQVNRKGGSIYLHNRPNYVTVGICASSTKLSMPNVMLLKCTLKCYAFLHCYFFLILPFKKLEDLFLPLQFVDLSVHSANKRRLKLKLVNGRAYYLELCASPQRQSEIFSQWVHLPRRLGNTSIHCLIKLLVSGLAWPKFLFKQKKNFKLEYSHPEQITHFAVSYSFQISCICKRNQSIIHTEVIRKHLILGNFVYHNQLLYN
uniref:Golgi associated RAB2 interactor protein-like Rab2B-binding domain-containing protein n=1 Tax=Pseudonaja textilis TaxID=8673 RepID=A0A670Z928_PSETE